MTRSLSIVNAVIFDGESDRLRAGTIEIEDDAVVGIGTSGSDGAEVIDAAGGMALPGLIDAHFHAYGVGLTLWELEATPMSYAAHKAARRLTSALRRGFTTVRDVAGGDLGLRRAVDEGLVLGPRYLFCGRAFTQTGGHGDARPADLGIELCCSHMGEIVDGADALRARVRDRFRTGAHAIKLMTSGGVLSPTDPLRVPQYSAEEIRAATDEAARRGSYVAAHAYSPEAIIHSVVNGVRTIEHGNLLDDESAAAMASRETFLVPTLVTYDAMARRGADLGLPVVSQEKNRTVLEAGLGSLGTARRAGVRVGFGTDLMGDLEADQLLEFRIRTDAEAVLDVLRSATSVNADILGRPDLGRIREGAPADVVVLAGNPLDDPAVLWEGDRVVVRSGSVVR